MIKIIPIFAIFLSMNCWAPHYSNYGGTRFQDFIIQSPTSIDGQFANSYSYDGGNLAVTFRASYDREALINTALASGGTAENPPSSIFIYEFNDDKWVLTGQIEEPILFDEFVPEFPSSASAPIIELPCTAEYICIKVTKNSGFASSVLIKGDYLFVGRSREGKISIYQKDGSLSSSGLFNWILINEIAGPFVADSIDGFASNIKSNGEQLIVKHNGPSPSSPRHIIIYDRDGADYKWALNKVITGNAGFGHDFDVNSSDLIIGDPSTDKLFIYRKDLLGNFELFQEIQSPSPNDTGFVFEFGGSISLDGNQFTVTESRFYSPLGHTDKGAAYLFEKNASGNWERKDFINPNPIGEGEFGWDSSMNNDILIINDSYFHLSIGLDIYEDAGIHHLFIRTPDNVWELIGHLSITDAAAHKNFGYSGNITVSDAGFVFSSHAPDGEDGKIYIHDLRNIDGTYSSETLIEETIPTINNLSLAALSLLIFLISRLRLNKN